MPQLIDVLGKMTIGKDRIINTSEIYKKATLLPNQFPRPALTVKNRLKTTIQIGEEASSAKKYNDSCLDKNIFAPWLPELNRQPKTDCFQLQPINKIKQNANNELQNIRQEYMFSKWLQEVDARIQNLKLKP